MKWLKNIKKSDWKLLALYWLAIAPLITLVDYLDDDVSLNNIIGSLNIKTLSIYLFDAILDTITVLILVFWLFPKYVNKRKYLLAFSLLLIIIISQIIFQHTLFGMFFGYLNPDFITRLLRNLIDNSVTIGLISTFLIGKHFFETKTEIVQIQKEKKEHELRWLKAQIDPHFLFNNLNILDILINTDPQKAKAYNLRLASLYRYLIRHKGNDVVSLAEEWKFSEDYIFLLQQRFGIVFKFNNQVDKNNLDNYFIPPASMQTLIENVVKHNIASQKNPIIVDIYLEEEFLCVSNNVKLKEEKVDSTSTGLTNLSTRIKLLTNKTLEIKKTANEFLVRIPLVKEKILAV